MHIGIIMDGNGRWTQKYGKNRTFGHNEGLKSAKKIVEHCLEKNIDFVTLYAFSTENWKRSEKEVSFLMSLISKHLKKEMDFYKKNSIRVRFTGDINKLNKSLIKEIRDVEEETKKFSKLTVVLAINYGGRDEIVRAINKAIKDNQKNFSEKTISNYLDNKDIPEPDLIIRTAGEKRLSNFLLWESAYSEFYFTDELWPDFNEKSLDIALEDYNRRVRKFGGVVN